MHDAETDLAFEEEEQQLAHRQRELDRYVGELGLWRYDKYLLWGLGESHFLSIVDRLRTGEQSHIGRNGRVGFLCKRCGNTKIALREVRVPLLYLVDVFTNAEHLVNSGRSLVLRYRYCPWCDGVQPSFDTLHVIRARQTVHAPRPKLVYKKSKQR